MNHKLYIEDRRDEGRILCQSLADLVKDGTEEDFPTMSQYSFPAQDWFRLKEQLAGGDSVEERLAARFCSPERGWFDAEAFERFCGENQIYFSYRSHDCILVCPDREEDGEFLCFLKSKKLRLPPDYRPRHVPRTTTHYWPLRIDLKSKETQEIVSVIGCAAYCSGNVLLKTPGLYNFSFKD